MVITLVHVTFSSKALPLSEQGELLLQSLQLGCSASLCVILFKETRIEISCDGVDDDDGGGGGGDDDGGGGGDNDVLVVYQNRWCTCMSMVARRCWHDHYVYTNCIRQRRCPLIFCLDCQCINHVTTGEISIHVQHSRVFIQNETLTKVYKNTMSFQP